MRESLPVTYLKEAIIMAKKINPNELGPTQAWVEFNKAKENVSENNRVKKVIRDHYLPMVEKSGRALVLFTDDESVDHGFEIKISRNFKKTEFENRLMKEFTKAQVDKIMTIFDESKTGLSKTFTSF